MSKIARVQHAISHLILRFDAKEKQSALQIFLGFLKIKIFLIKNNKKSVNLQNNIVFLTTFSSL